MRPETHGKIERQISLPLQQAFRISFKNIYIRLGRAMITAAGTFLGIFFLMSVFTTRVVLMSGTETMDPTTEARQKWLVVMSLLVSSVGITNAMLMSVTERFREIGTMKCLGALDNFIVKLFLIESGMLGVLGSIGGAIAGSVLMLLVYWAKLGGTMWTHLHWMDLFGSLGLSVALGTILSVVAALPPAMRAAKLPPATALRTEI